MIKSSDSVGEICATSGVGSLPFANWDIAIESACSADIPYFPQGVGKNRNELEFQRFVDYLRSSSKPLAKAQSFGVFTLSRGETGQNALSVAEIEACFERTRQTVLCMAREIQSLGKAALVFLDEPSWLLWNPQDSVHRLAQEKNLEILAALQSLGARTGVHCCARIDWHPWLCDSLNYLSFDCELSLRDILNLNDPLRLWMQNGGRLAPGVVPTAIPADYEVAAEVQNFLDLWNASFSKNDADRYLRESILTPACGLGTRAESVAGEVWTTLLAFKDALIRRCNWL